MRMEEADLRRMNQVLRHRLRNFASGMKAAMSVLSQELKGRLTPAEQEYFPLIQNECDGITSVTNRLNLAFDDFPASPAMQTGEIVDKVRENLHQVFPLAIVDYPVTPEAASVPVTEGKRLVIILEELIANAIEAAPGKPVQVLGTVEERILMLRVLDTGPGIKESIMNDVMAPFFTTRPQHLGLGLVIARRFADSLGARITLSPRQPSGVEATVAMPCQASDRQDSL